MGMVKDILDFLWGKVIVIPYGFVTNTYKSNSKKILNDFQGEFSNEGDVIFSEAKNFDRNYFDAHGFFHINIETKPKYISGYFTNWQGMMFSGSRKKLKEYLFLAKKAKFIVDLFCIRQGKMFNYGKATIILFYSDYDEPLIHWVSHGFQGLYPKFCELHKF